MKISATVPITQIPEIRSRLGAAVLGDICDSLGRLHQCLPPQLHPMKPDMKLVGRAMPVLMGDTFGGAAKPFGRLTEALDQLTPGEIYITGGGLQRSAYWGEILTVTAKQRGAVGAIIDGWHRDSRQILEQNWQVFSRGAFAQDSGARSQVADFRVPIEVGGVMVMPGDLVVADLDGIVVIPQDLEAEIVDRAMEKVSREAVMLTAIKNGMSSTEAWSTFGVL